MARPKIKFVPAKLHVKTGDTVYVISGKDKGKTGKVLKVFPKKGKVVVEGINMVTKHMKPSQMNPQGGVVTKPAPMFSSKVMLFDEKAGKPTRVGFKMVDGKKVRYSKVSGENL
ncbi:MAG: 50S ribosomal protein L24 [Cetobacterium sp.]|uniref:Large ribosomal subunit protein uL24 n=1 Tax=Cetobacterium ceti TaxID=180163 RepID=A0A1T4Q3A1_9FUSO|nr:50S ribosomal protein L24 [Cetobacterium ceti]MCJ8341779.1 50S ribosomal protein L24 [Cetobacterium sp.]SJZ98243.1 large subunit ribosomal protein L24 [Cetobacterium ceti]